MAFELQLEDRDAIDLQASLTEHGRFYHIPASAYGKTDEDVLLPSVTTVLKHVIPESQEIAQWKARVGDAAAAATSRVATNRGKTLHDMLEKYVRGQPLPQNIMPVNMELFKQFKGKLDQHLSIVYGIEQALFSRTLKIAGRADLIGEWDGIPALIDYKTSNYEQTKESIHHYFIQCAIYSMMWFTCAYPPADKLVVILGGHGTQDGQVIEGWLYEYEHEARHLIDQYHKLQACK